MGEQTEGPMPTKTETTTTTSVEQLKKQLLDPRAISKQHGQEKRSSLALSASQAKTESRETKEQISKEEEIKERAGKEKDDLLLTRGQKNFELEQRLGKTLVRLKKAVGLDDKKASEIQSQLDSTDSELSTIYEELDRVKQELGESREREEEIPDPREMLQAYYEKVRNKPLANEEKRQYLTPEFLANLSTEEYIALWRRLNPFFLAHVTRQGFRDHNAMVYHSSGLEEFHNGLISMLEDEKMLRPPLALRGLRTRDKESVRDFLNGWVLEAEDKKEAQSRLDRLLHHTLATAPNYPDKTAVHFTTQLVADHYYGGETGNESFIVFPSDFLASQHSFALNGWEKDFTKPQSETKWNDVFIWPNTTENSGIPLDAGIVFLPKNTPVDPNTGSRYASEVKVIGGSEKRAMVEDEKLTEAYLSWASDLTDDSPVFKAFRAYEDERHQFYKERLKHEYQDLCRQEFESLGFAPDAAAALSYGLFRNLHYEQSISYISENEERARHILEQSGAHWKRAENAIPAKKYWERYFKEHPEFQPKHIVYYDGSPTSAIHAFLGEHEIGKADTSETEGKLLGFNDHHVADMREDPRANIGYDELVETANKIISEHYKGK